MLGGDLIMKKKKEAVATDLGGERIKRLHRIELVLCEIALAERRHAEIDKLGKRAAAEPACNAVVHPVKHAIYCTGRCHRKAMEYFPSPTDFCGPRCCAKHDNRSRSRIVTKCF